MKPAGSQRQSEAEGVTVCLAPGRVVPLWLLVSCTSRGIARIRFLRRPATRISSLAQQQRFARRYPWFRPALAALRAIADGQLAVGSSAKRTLIPVDLTSQAPFYRRVQEACREIPLGQTETYGGLARRLRRPRAARAVGAAMRHNPVPLLIPCHRVVRGDGSLGGYSAPTGLTLKTRLLALERQHARLGE
jgi:methylated-DNA-[protein]-cysteine S-methyltransferase